MSDLGLEIVMPLGCLPRIPPPLTEEARLEFCGICRRVRARMIRGY